MMKITRRSIWKPITLALAAFVGHRAARVAHSSANCTRSKPHGGPCNGLLTADCHTHVAGIPGRVSKELVCRFSPSQLGFQVNQIYSFDNSNNHLAFRGDNLEDAVERQDLWVLSSIFQNPRNDLWHYLWRPTSVVRGKLGGTYCVDLFYGKAPVQPQMGLRAKEDGSVIVAVRRKVDSI